MKKVKTITFHRAHNYGAVLQAYALQNYIKKNGFETEILDYINPKVEKMYKPFYNPYNNFFKGIMRFVRNLIYISPIMKRYKAFNKFIEKNFTLTKTVYNKNEVNEIIDDDDILVTGSDQVWNLNLTGGFSDIYTLNVGNETNKRISYAASVGNNDYIVNNKNYYNEKLSLIDHISVREESTRNAIKENLNINSTVVLDPVFLLEKDEWNDLLEKTEINEKNYIFCYMLKVDKNCIDGANYISKKTGLPVIHADLRNKGFKNMKKSIFTLGPWEFLKYLKEAEYVVTSSFHATAFSLIFHKKVFVISHKYNGVRTNDLLKKFNLQNRAFSSIKDLEAKNIFEDIQWDKVDEQIIKDTAVSKQWLIDSLNFNK